MGWFAWLIECLTWAGLGFAFFVTYLKLNKVWIRRYDRNVADSISVTAVTLGLFFNTLPAFIKFAFVEPDFSQAGKEAVKLFAALVFFAIGIGYWARSDQRRGVMSLIRRAFKLEGQEATALARNFIQPVGAEKIINILDQVALIDRDYEESELRFVSAFAKAWHLEHDQDLVQLNARVGPKPQDEQYIELRKSLRGYLKLHPPREQAAHLMDVIRALITVDEKTTTEEQFILTEIEGIINHYLHKGEKRDVYSVLVVPQNPEQESAIKAILPEAELTERSGGRVFVVDSFHSGNFAEMICEKYRTMQFFTMVEGPPKKR